LAIKIKILLQKCISNQNTATNDFTNPQSKILHTYSQTQSVTQ